MPAYLTRIGNLTLGSRFDGRLHIGGGIIDRLVIRQCSVGIVLDGLRTVSYTHLTLPTIYSV